MQIATAFFAGESIPLKAAPIHPIGPGCFLRCGECWLLRDASAFSESGNRVSMPGHCACREAVLCLVPARRWQRLLRPVALPLAGECWQWSEHTYFWVRPWPISFPTASYAAQARAARLSLAA